MTRPGVEELVSPGSEAPAGILDRNVLRARIAAVADYVAGRGGGQWLVHEPDVLKFAAYLYGITLGGGNVTLLPDVRPGTLASLDRTYEGQVGEQVVADGYVPSSAFDSGGDPQAMPAVAPGDVTVLTSGTTGDRKRFTRSLDQHLAEAEALQGNWPLDDRLVVGSMVSHHHMYGLALGIFWPLAYGACLLTTNQSPVPDFATLDNTVGRRLRLVASPTYLNRMEASLGLANFNDNRGQTVAIDCVFSAGAPLDRDRAVVAARHWACPINEIYGSSETGAVATRRADQDGPWRALPGVKLKIEEGRLLLDAPYIARGLTRPFVSADRVVTEGDSFRLLGRADRVVKVEGKRVSLQQVEDAAGKLDWVDTCVAVLLDDEHRRIALAVVLDDSGRSMLQRDGKASLDKQLRQVLVHDLEAVMVPRRVRYLAVIPATPEGKVDKEKLRTAFTNDARRRPTIHAVVFHGDRVELDLLLDPDLNAFEGHFPVRAVLPGVALLHWVMLLAHDYLGAPLRAVSLANVKFMSILAPNDRLRLVLSRGDDVLDYKCLCAGTTASRGRIKLHD